MADSTPSVPAAKTKEPFAVQAAKFSLYAPIVAIILGCITTAALKQNASDPSTSTLIPSATKVIGFFNLMLLVTGFFMSIYALISIRTYGARGILWRSLVGLLLNGFFVGALVMMLLFSPSQKLAAKYQGHWRASSPPLIADKIDLQLDQGGKGQISMTFLNQPPITGKWSVVLDRQRPGQAFFIFRFDAPTAIGTQTADSMRWEIVKFEQDTLTFRSQDGIEIYKRVK